MTSLLTDALFNDLLAVGEVDILVGLPTNNHQQTVGAVVSAVVSAFAGPYVRQRTVLLNLDGGSTDATLEAVRNATPASELLSARYALRTIHRVTAPYHGIPGRGSALRILLTAAELLRARAVLVVDPSAAPLDGRDVEAFIQAVWQGQADYVKPALPRAHADGPLVTQLVRPLFRAAYGHRLLEPIDTQFACSNAFVSSALAADFWGLSQIETGVDVFLSAHALGGSSAIKQVATGARGRVEHDRRPGVAEVFRQVVGSVLYCLSRTFSGWRDIQGSRPVPIEGALPSPGPGPHFDALALAHAYRSGVDALSPLLSKVLEPSLVERLLGCARAPRVSIDAELWAQTVFQCLDAAIRGAAPTNQLAQMLEPLYLGRVAGFLEEEAHPGAADPSEALALAFEEQKLTWLARLQDQEK